MEEKKNKAIKVGNGELVIHVNEVHIVKQQSAYESTQTNKMDSNESNTRSPWDLF